MKKTEYSHALDARFDYHELIDKSPGEVRRLRKTVLGRRRGMAALQVGAVALFCWLFHLAMASALPMRPVLALGLLLLGGFFCLGRARKREKSYAEFLQLFLDDHAHYTALYRDEQAAKARQAEREAAHDPAFFTGQFQDALRRGAPDDRR